MRTGKKGLTTHFELKQLAENAWAAIARDGGAAISNAGFVDLGGQVVVFDSFLTPQAARELEEAVEGLTGQKAGTVINSHHHNDHIWGNQVFAEHARILSSQRTREAITAGGMDEYRWFAKNAQQKLDEIQSQHDAAGDEKEREKVTLWLGYYRGLVEALPTLKVCAPSLTFSGRLEIHGERSRVQLSTFEGGHSSSDTVMFLPEEGILFMGDLLFTQFHPYLADGDPSRLLEALKEVSKWEATTLVPGHGPVGRMEDLELFLAYIEECNEIARGLVESGKGDACDEVHVPAMFSHWKMPQFFHANLRFLQQRLGGTRQE